MYADDTRLTYASIYDIDHTLNIMLMSVNG